MFTKNEVQTVFFTIFLLLNSLFIFAQDDTDDGPQGPPTASIDTVLYPMILIAIVLGALFFYKKNALDNFK